MLLIIIKLTVDINEVISSVFYTLCVFVMIIGYVCFYFNLALELSCLINKFELS